MPAPAERRKRKRPCLVAREAEVSHEGLPSYVGDRSVATASFPRERAREVVG
jgi:hypothetical protein